MFSDCSPTLKSEKSKKEYKGSDHGVNMERYEKSRKTKKERKMGHHAEQRMVYGVS